MPTRTELTAQAVPRLTAITIGSAGTELTGDATNNHKFLNPGNILLFVRNSDADNDHTITIYQAPGTQAEGQSAGSITYTITKATEVCLGPFPPQIYNQTGGYLNVDVSHATIKLTALAVALRA